MQKSILYQLLPLISIVLATSQVLSAQNMEKILQSDTTKFNYGGTDLLDIDLQLGGSNDKTGKVVPMSDKNTTPTKINAPANTGLVPNSLDKNTTTKVTPDSRQPAGNTLPIAQTRPVAPGQTPPPAYVPATVENQIPRHKLISPPPLNMAYLPPFAAMYERKHKRGILHQFLVLLPLNALYGTNYVATNEIHTIHANKHPTTRRNRAGFRSSTRRRTKIRRRYYRRIYGNRKR